MTGKLFVGVFERSKNNICGGLYCKPWEMLDVLCKLIAYDMHVIL